MICANGKCKKRFTPEKPWARYCSEACGDIVRHLAYRGRTKKLKTRGIEQQGRKR